MARRFSLGWRPLQQNLHDFLCAGIRRTPPAPIRPGALAIVSLVSGRDFLMYLAAIKSFYARIGQGAVYAIDDGTLSPAQRAELKANLPGINLLHIAEAPAARVPKGGCWERLLHLVEIGRSSYVIQLDADTLTRLAIPEVLNAVRAGHAFILSGDEAGAAVLSREEIARRVGAGHHIQTVMERRLAEDPALKPFYVRGSGAFFGFPAGAVSLAEVEEFSGRMQRLLGERWQEWGSEQATVNYLAANLPGCRVLQPPKYTHRWRLAPRDDSAFVHFIGTYRFDGQYYARETRKAIRALRAPAGLATEA